MHSKDIPLTETVYYILLALRCPKHGYRIIKETSELTAGRVQLGAGTLYGALRTLQSKGWIRTESEVKGARGKTEYTITPNGKRVLDAEIGRLREALDNAAAVKGEKPC